MDVRVVAVECAAACDSCARTSLFHEVFPRLRLDIKTDIVERGWEKQGTVCTRVHHPSLLPRPGASVAGGEFKTQVFTKEMSNTQIVGYGQHFRLEIVNFYKKSLFILPVL